MFSFKAVLCAMALASTAVTVQAAPADLSVIETVASALNVTVSNISALQTAADVSVIDVKTWTDPLGQGPLDVNDWDDDIKITFLQEVKSGLEDALNTALSKRAKGSDSPAARAQVAAGAANAKAQRDASNRRKLLQCNSGSQGRCTACAAICSAAWASGVAICSGAALGAETTSAGTLTPPVAVSYAGCLGLASSAYAACIVKCVG